MANVTLAALKGGAPYTVATPGIARSTNLGGTWTQVYTASTSPWVQWVMSLCDTPSGIFGITYYGQLLKSTDVGLTWSDLGQIHATATSCNSIGYIGNNTLVVACSLGTNSAFISYDMGNSWSVLMTSPYRMYHVLDMGSGVAIILGADGYSTGYEYKTTNYGASWSSVAGIGTFIAYDAVHVGSGTVIATGAAAGTPVNQIYKSIDYGNTWSLVYNVGFWYTGISVGWVPSTNYVFATFEYAFSDATRLLYRSTDLGLTWTSLGNQGAVSLYGGSGSTLYSGRTTSLCPGITPNASIRVSYDFAATWPITATPYDPTLFLEIASAVAPVADFSAAPMTGLQALNTTFTDLSTNTPTSWLWNFGDGSTGALQNPTHGYTGVGSYTVELTATNSAGSDTETKVNYITVFSADFTGTPTSGNADLNVAFTDTTPGAPTSWLWDFGDGSTSTLQNPNHTYTTAGTYTVIMSVNGGASTKTRIDYITVGLSADFTGGPVTGVTPFFVQFNDSSKGAPTTWAWDFGDGTFSAQKNPAKVYSTQGTYDVTLTVTKGLLSATVTKAAYVAVVPAENIATYDNGLPPEVAAVVVARATVQTKVLSAPGNGVLVSTVNVSGTIEAGFKRLDGPSITLG